MEQSIAQSSLVPVQNMEDGSQKSSEQSFQDHRTLIPNSTDVSGCCRLCCNEDSHLRELFAGGYKEELLVRKIFECTTVEITLASDPDALICYSCVAKIEEFHHYREQCRTNDVLHRNWKRRLGGQIATASSSSSMILPAKYIKKEKDVESFEINAGDFFPVDVPQQSDEMFGMHGPIASIADSSSAVNASSAPNEHDVCNTPEEEEEEEEEEENLLELMPERPQDEFRFLYTNDNEEVAKQNDFDCDVPIKEEMPDIDDTAEDIWNNFEDDVSMDHTSALIPLMESSSYSVSVAPETDSQRPFREVYNGEALVCLVQDGFLYIQKGKGQWHCRVEDCAAAIIRRAESEDLETNNILHTHNKEVENSATDLQIWQLLKNASPNGMSDELFHYVKNAKKGNSIVYKGYRYGMKHSRLDGTIFWKCNALNGTCPAGLYQSTNNEFETVETHLHKQQESSCETTQHNSNVTDDDVDELAENTPLKTKIKLRIGQQPNAMESRSLSPSTGGEKNDDLQTNQKDDKRVVRKGYGHKIVNNANGRPRLHFDGNLYVRESARADGVVVWRCRRNYDMCGVVAFLHPDGLVEVRGNHDHSSIKSTMSITENMTRTKNYELSPTWKGGEALVLNGYRFLKAYSRVNGMSLWRCVGSLGVVCRVKVTTDADGVAYISKNEQHLHDKPKRPHKSPSKVVENTQIKEKQADSANKNEKKMVRLGHQITNKACSPVRKTVNVTRKSNECATTSAAGKSLKVMSKSQTARNYRIIKNKKGNKALVYGGYRYCKIRTRQDGSICWVCRMNKKTCRAGVYQYPDGRFEWINERRHNHSPTDATEPSASPSPPPKKMLTKVVKKRPFHIDDETFVSSEWYLVRNKKNGASLIHAGYRYNKKADRSDNTSMWRCSQASNGCRAGIVMYTNETIAKLEDIDHIHPPPAKTSGDEDIIFNDLDISKESASTSKHCSNPGARIANLNRCIEEKDDPEANMRSLLNSTLDISDEPKNEVSGKIVIPAAEAHYRYVKNRRHTQGLVFRGFRYSRSTMRERSDGTVKWICQMNRKTCRVSLKIMKDGSLEMDDQKHNHLQLPEDMDDNFTDEDDDNDDNASAWDETPDDHKNETHNKQIKPKVKEEQDYYFALNRANGESLIFQQNRFSKDYSRPDGSTVWRCMVRQACIGRALLRPDNTCSMYRNTYHNHPPLDVLPPPLRYPPKETSSQASPEQTLLADLAAEIQDASSSVIVKGDMVIYKQNRMKKIKSFPDGTAMYACAELDSCKSLVKLQLDSTEGTTSSPVILFEWPHNHPSFLTAASNSSKSAAQDFPQKIPTKMSKQSTKGVTKSSKEFQLYKSDRGHITLVYKGYRFSLRSHNNITDDTAWKCRANRTCNAFVAFTKDGKVVRQGNGKAKAVSHNHPINGEYIERAVPFELADLDPPAENLGVFAAQWLNGTYSGTLSGKPINSSSSSPKTTERIDRHKVIHHKNFSYKLQTIKNGRECWRCTMFQTRACRAALFCHKNGKIVECTNGRPHNHEATKSRSDAQEDVTPHKTNSGPRAKSTATETAVAVYRGSEQYSDQNNKHQPNEESAESPTPAYQVVQRDGVNILHYERHRYVALSKRDAADKPSRWRCCLWNSRHQCPVELKILPTDEIHFETDPTHNHRPPPAEPLEMERAPSVPNVKGSRKYQLMGRSERTVFYKGYKYFWKERKDDMTHYNCICNVSHGCPMSVKIDPNGLLFECSNASHNHEATAEDSRLSTSSQLYTPEAIKHESSKTMRHWSAASKQARMEQCSKVGSSDYTFVRSSQGVSMLFAGHKYWFHSKLSCGLHIYRCRYQKLKDCTGSVYLDTETNLLHHRFDAMHNHEPEMEDAASKAKVNDVVGGIPDNSAQKPSSKKSSYGSNEKHGEPFAQNQLYPVVPKKERIKKEVTITDEYSFLKDSYSKNLLLYQDYVFEFLASHYRNNGSKFYSCLYSECSASVKLLSSGSLKVFSPVHHAHERPDLTDYRTVGRGSADYRLLPTAPGSNPVILFEGHRYCASASQALPDNTTIFYCSRKKSSAAKINLNGRCLASLELLPNGRVITDGIHQHPVCSQPTSNDSDTPNSSESTEANLMVMEGRSYRYYDKRQDGTVVRICADDPRCMAKLYRAPGGKWEHGKTKHVLRHVIPKVVNPKVVPVLPAASTSAAPTTTSNHLPNANPSSSGNLRTKWFEGNRYNFYLTRRDGVQYWRCSKRMEENCDAGILCYPSGTIMPANTIPHTHSKIEPNSSKSSHNVVQRPTVLLPDEGQRVRENTEPTSLVFIKSESSDGSGKSQYEILKKDERKKMFMMYKGVQYMLRNQRSDGIWIYRCRNRYCTYTLLMTKSGKIIPKTTCWHSCENSRQPQNNNETASKSTSFASVSDLSSDKPEIEDPDDVINENESTEERSTTKRIRLNSGNFVELELEQTAKQNSEDEDVDEERLRCNSRSASESSGAAIEPAMVSVPNLPEVEPDEAIIEESSSSSSKRHSPLTENIPTIEWEEEHLEQNDEYDEAAVNTNDDVEDFELDYGSDVPSKELPSSNNPCTNFTRIVVANNNTEDNDSNTGFKGADPITTTPSDAV
uniref:Uncharacterized protein n=1 Tax=Anopheles coluzzii TaxID=1518534 RepID=A0A6E8VJH3_ANOCL|nr:uncharacterized protein LOC120951102 [Anopheles coluzzii]